MQQVGRLAEVLAGIPGPGRLELDDGRTDIGAHAGIFGRLGDDVGEEILVAEAGDAGLQHLGDRELGAVPNHLGADPALLDRPHPVTKPGSERQVVCVAAQQRHRGMGMGVDQARNHHVTGALDDHARLVTAARLVGRQHGRDPAVDDRDGMALEDCSRRLDRHDPGGRDEAVAVLHGRRSIQPLWYDKRLV